MALTVKEVCERLLQVYDVDTLVELLGVTAEELLDRFEDKVEDRFDALEREVAPDNEDETND